MMTMMERSEAINRAQRALRALGEHPRSSQKELGHAGEHLNAGYSHSDSDQVWDSVTKVETMADRRYGAPSPEEQRTDPSAAAYLEEPATATRGRHAEDFALRPAPAGEDARSREDYAASRTRHCADRPDPDRCEKYGALLGVGVADRTRGSGGLGMAPYLARDHAADSSLGRRLLAARFAATLSICPPPQGVSGPSHVLSVR
jgi:hypothetical protein